MPVTWDVDTAAITRDEYRATALLSVLAWTGHQPMPMSTPLQRAASRATVRAWCDQQLAAMKVTCPLTRPGPTWTHGCTWSATCGRRRPEGHTGRRCLCSTAGSRRHCHRTGRSRWPSRTRPAGSGAHGSVPGLLTRA